MNTNLCSNCNSVPLGCFICLSPAKPKAPVRVILRIRPRQMKTICPFCGQRIKGIVILCPKCKQQIPPGSVQ